VGVKDRFYRTIGGIPASGPSVGRRRAGRDPSRAPASSALTLRAPPAPPAVAGFPVFASSAASAGKFAFQAATIPWTAESRKLGILPPEHRTFFAGCRGYGPKMRGHLTGVAVDLRGRPQMPINRPSSFVFTLGCSSGLACRFQPSAPSPVCTGVSSARQSTV